MATDPVALNNAEHILGTGGAYVGCPLHTVMWGAPNMRAFGTQAVDRLVMTDCRTAKLQSGSAHTSCAQHSHKTAINVSTHSAPPAAAPCMCATPLTPCSVPWVDDAGNIRVNRGFRVQVRPAAAPARHSLTHTLCHSSGHAHALAAKNPKPLPPKARPVRSHLPACC